MDLKPRRPIPHYTLDRAVLVGRSKNGVRLSDDPPAVERLQGAEFLDTDGTLTEKGVQAVQELARLAVERRVPSPRYPT